MNTKGGHGEGRGIEHFWRVGEGKTSTFIVIIYTWRNTQFLIKVRLYVPSILVLDCTQKHDPGLCSKWNQTCISRGPRVEKGAKSMTPWPWILRHWGSNRVQEMWLLRNLFDTVLYCCLHIKLKRSKVPLIKQVTLTVRVNEPQEIRQIGSEIVITSCE